MFNFTQQGTSSEIADAGENDWMLHFSCILAAFLETART
jgi:hypothetical protein